MLNIYRPKCWVRRADNLASGIARTRGRNYEDSRWWQSQVGHERKQAVKAIVVQVVLETPHPL